MKPISRKLAMSILIVVFTASCAYQSAMNDGKKLVEAGQYDDAVLSFRKALREKPDSADAKIT